MLSEYLELAMDTAVYKMQEGGSYYAELPPFPGVWAQAPNMEECQRSLRRVLEDWVVVNLQRGNNLPEIAGIDLNSLALVSACADAFA